MKRYLTVLCLLIALTPCCTMSVSTITAQELSKLSRNSQCEGGQCPAPQFVDIQVLEKRVDRNETLIIGLDQRVERVERQVDSYPLATNQSDIALAHDLSPAVSNVTAISTPIVSQVLVHEPPPLAPITFSSSCAPTRLATMATSYQTGWVAPSILPAVQFDVATPGISRTVSTAVHSTGSYASGAPVVTRSRSVQRTNVVPARPLLNRRRFRIRARRGCH